MRPGKPRPGILPGRRFPKGEASEHDADGRIAKYGDKISFMGEIDNKQVDFEGWTYADCEKAAVHAMESCGMKHFIPCITQGGPGSLYKGTYQGLWDAIDDYNCKHFGFTKEQLEAQRLPIMQNL